MPKRAAARRQLPSPSKSAAKTRRLLKALGGQHPNADTELRFTNAYELLVATILSAQCTDERVNQVTPALFRRYPDACTLARATTSELEPQIQPTGFFRAKSRSLLGMATAVVDRFGGEVPRTMAELVQLPGVGRKTANVVLGHALGVPGLPVDRHVLRVANRIGIARSDDPEVVEQQLCAALPSADWTRASDTLILHGRRICKPRPLCDRCAVRKECDFYRTLAATLVAPKPRGGRDMRQRPRAAKPRATGREGGAQRQIESSSTQTMARPRAAKPRAAGREGAAQRQDESSSTQAMPRPQAAKPRAAGREGEAQRQIESSSTQTMPRSRAAKRRATGREGGAQRQNESSSTQAMQRPRAAKPRGTGRGGGAPRQTK